MIKKILLITAILILIFIFLKTFLFGINTKPFEGDSLAYHIPIANNILKGHILKPNFYLAYYPSIGETILAIFLFLKLPLNLFNVIGSLILFLICLLIGKKYYLSKTNSFFFAFSIFSLNLIQRWINTEIIDIWLAVFFTSSLFLILNLKKNYLSFLFLGISLGLLMGTKYSSPLFIIVLLSIYWEKIKSKLNFLNIVFLITPILFLGFSWYIRNLIIIKNPIYPQSFFNLKGYEKWNIFQLHNFQIMIFKPVLFLDALISEYSFWPFLIFIILFFLFYKKSYLKENLNLLLLTFFNFLIFLVLPTTFRYNIIVSSLRYSLPLIIPGILLVFKISQEKKSELYLYFLSIINVLVILISPYKPKITIVIFLLVLIFYLKKTIKSRESIL